MFNSIADAVKALGEERALRYINKYAANMQYRLDRSKRIRREDKANRQLLERAKNDPRFAELFGKVKKVG